MPALDTFQLRTKHETFVRAGSYRDAEHEATATLGGQEVFVPTPS